MIWTESGGHAHPWGCDDGVGLESIISQVPAPFFGKIRKHLDVKKLAVGKTKNLDGVF